MADEVMVERGAVAVVMEIAADVVAVVAGQSVAGAYPDISFCVLRQGFHLLMGQPVAAGDMAETIVHSPGCQPAGGTEQQHYSSLHCLYFFGLSVSLLKGC